MYYFYIIENLRGRAGFGIAQDARERNKQYTSHSGDLVKFPFLFGGQRAHAKALEKTIKTQWVDNIWILDDWETEWLKDGITVHDLKNHVEQLIKTRHYKLALVSIDFDFRKENPLNPVDI
jgi:hypothetical protein